MTAAVIQMCSQDSVGANLAAAGRLLQQAAGRGARLAVLPENFAYMGVREADKLAQAELEGAGPIQDFLRAAAQRLALWVVAGTIPLKATPQDTRVRAACVVYDAHGERVVRYDKMHLFDVEVPAMARHHGDATGAGGGERYQESAIIEPGADAAVVVATPVGRLGLSVCYDLRFPELYRRLAEAGAELLAVPSAFTRRTGEAHWEVLLRARAIENQCYVLAPNQSGTHPGGRQTWGHSLIADPWGQVLAQCESGEGVAVAEISQDRLHQLRQSFPVLTHRRIRT
ncbi:MAG: carbon-nitrogen hydrolase family protein [Gammaproteobacteria bacterium]|nr:carbon-nitrogen hydrolase family protein [Gammaproteobacteria bacterium]